MRGQVFNHPEVMPYADGNGGIEWKPVGKFKKTMIDVATIKKRFHGFAIDVDWIAIEKMRCRSAAITWSTCTRPLRCAQTSRQMVSSLMGCRWVRHPAGSCCVMCLTPKNVNHKIHQARSTRNHGVNGLDTKDLAVITGS